ATWSARRRSRSRASGKSCRSKPPFSRGDKPKPGNGTVGNLEKLSHLFDRPCRGPRKTVFSRSNRDLFPFVVRYRTSVGAEVSKHERRGTLADCPSIPQGDGSIPHHARGLRFHGSPVFRGSLWETPTCRPGSGSSA